MVYALEHPPVYLYAWSALLLLFQFHVTAMWHLWPGMFFFTCHQVCMTACWTRAGCRKKKRKTSCRGARSHIIKLRVPSQLHRITHACCTEAPKKKRKHGRFFLQDAPEKFCFCSNLTCADRQYLISGVLLP